MSKLSKHQRHNLYVRARLKPGWVRWVFHFTFEWLWIFPAQTCQFSRPYFPETLDASREEGFLFILEPTPQPFDGWTGSHFPLCSEWKKVCPEWCQPFGTLHFVQAVFSCQHYFSRRQEKNWRKILREWTKFLKRNTGDWSRTTMRTCDIFYIYTCVLLSDNIRTIRLQVIRWKLPTQPVSSRNK